jgi:Flp pilus assembly protein CpaB
LNPGDRVDVYATSTRPGEPTETKLIATSMYILEAQIAESSTSKDRVTLLLAVDQATARTLATAMHAGEIDLVKVGR